MVTRYFATVTAFGVASRREGVRGVPRDRKQKRFASAKLERVTRPHVRRRPSR